ncbi:MAG: histidinol-phosphate transaminase [Alphaproteobacteria bacterium]|nr:histidinol-phosphate transaminase [Alphaproteobacteria bacterium]
MPQLSPKPGILDIAPYVGGKSSTRPGVKTIKLSSNENPLGASPLAASAYSAAAATLHRYPDGSAAKLREAIKHVHGLPAENLICGAGSDELIGLLIHAYAGVGDEVLMSRHGFLMYQIYAQGFGASVVMAPEKNLHTDVDAMLAAVSPRTRIVFVANPNNPTGTYLPRSELHRLHAGLPSNVLLVIDDAYSEYVTADDYSDGHELVRHGNVCALHTFSKIHGLSALRVGWGVTSAEIASVIGRIRGPFNLSTPAIEAAAAAIMDETFIRTSRDTNNQQLAWMQRELTALGLQVVPSVTNFVLVRFAGEPHSAKQANSYLTERGIIPREVASYGLADYLRISIGLAQENRAVIDTLKQFLGR